MRRITTIGVRSQGNFDEPDQRTVLALSYVDHSRQVPARFAGEEWGEIFCMLLKAFLWPQRATHAREFSAVFRACAPDQELLHSEIIEAFG